MSATPARIEVRLRELAQLFNSMDPSPFHERDLDGDAEEFILSWTREIPAHEEIELVVQLAVAPPPERSREAANAVRHHFSTLATLKHREFRLLLRRGRLALIIGLLFLAACLMVGQFIGARHWGTASKVIEESLTIGGWVAMWRPLEIYLYDWWPLRAEQRNLERLGRMQVTLVPPPG